MREREQRLAILEGEAHDSAKQTYLLQQSKEELAMQVTLLNQKGEERERQWQERSEALEQEGGRLSQQSRLWEDREARARSSLMEAESVLRGKEQEAFRERDEKELWQRQCQQESDTVQALQNDLRGIQQAHEEALLSNDHLENSHASLRTSHSEQNQLIA